MKPMGRADTCGEWDGVKGHPARFPAKLPEFFIRFLTDPGDLVVDIFGGSNTTGQVAEAEERRWITYDMEAEYVAAGAFRFLPREFAEDKAREIYRQIVTGEAVDFCKEYRPRQAGLFEVAV